MLDELLLQGTIDIGGLGDDEEATGAHIEAMGHLAFGIALAHHRIYRILLDATWYRQHAAGLIDHHDGIVFIHHRELHTFESLQFWVWVDIQSL